MFKGKIENWILIDSVINPGIKVEGNNEDQRIITSGALAWRAIEEDFIQNMTHRIDYYNPIEKISENWQFVERELPLEKITYEVDEGFILV